MGKIISYKGKLPKRLDGNLVIYPMGGDTIIRLKSGFTTEELLNAEKYENCRKNASEFGRISKACKGIRLALEGILPKQNNLTIVNTLTKHMRSLVNYDLEHVKGERKLATALQQEDGLRLFQGYNFNPDTTIALTIKFIGEQLEIKSCTLADGISWVGFRLHVLDYDWDAFNGKLHSSGWHFEHTFNKPFLYTFPTVKDVNNHLIFLVEAQPFIEKEGAFMPVRVEEKTIIVANYSD